MWLFFLEQGGAMEYRTGHRPRLDRPSTTNAVSSSRSRASGLLSGAPCSRSRFAAGPVGHPRPTPSVFPSLDRGTRRAQGRRAGERCPSTLAGSRSRHRPRWLPKSLGVGRVARRRDRHKAIFLTLPRLTLKAGHKEGCPQSSRFGAKQAPAFGADPFFKRMHPILGIINMCIAT